MTLNEVKEKYPLNNTIVGTFYEEIISDNKPGATNWKEAQEIMLNPPEYCFPRIEKTTTQEYSMIWFWWRPVAGYAEFSNHSGLLVIDFNSGLYDFINPEFSSKIYSMDEAVNLFKDNPNIYSTWEAVKTARNI